MAGGVSRLVRQSGVYALGNAAVKLSGLLLALLYLNPAYLSTEAFGYFGLLFVTAQLGTFIVGLGLSQGLLKFMTDESHASARPALPFTALVATMGVAAVAVLLFWASSAPLAAFLLDDASRRRLIMLVAFYVAFKVIGAIPLALLRVQERPGLYVLAVGAEMGVLIGGTYYGLAIARQGLEGLMMAYALSAGVSMVMLVGGMLTRTAWAFQRPLVMPLMRYGAPLVLAGLSSWFLMAGDRYVLKLFVDADTIGLYEWASRISSTLKMLLVDSFQLAFAVAGLKQLGTGDVSLHRRTFRHYVIGTGWAVLALSLLAYDLNGVLVRGFGAAPHYLNSSPLVFPLALGFMAFGVYVVVNNVLYATGHTKAIGANVALAAALNAALNVALIPVLGALGAALTTLFSYAVLAGLSARIAKGKVHVDYDWRVLVVVVVLVVGLYGIMWPSRAWPVYARLPLRLAAILAYLPLLLAFRLYTWEEVRLGWRHAKRRWAHLRH